MRKKVLVGLLIGVSLLSFVGCGEKKANPNILYPVRVYSNLNKNTDKENKKVIKHIEEIMKGLENSDTKVITKIDKQDIYKIVTFEVISKDMQKVKDYEETIETFKGLSEDLMKIGNEKGSNDLFEIELKENDYTTVAKFNDGSVNIK